MVMSRIGSPVFAVVPSRAVRVGRVVVRAGVAKPSVTDVATVAGGSPAAGRNGTGGDGGKEPRGGSLGVTEGTVRNGAGRSGRNGSGGTDEGVKQKEKGTKGIGWVFPGVQLNSPLLVRAG